MITQLADVLLEAQQAVAQSLAPIMDVCPRCGGCGKLLAVWLTRPWRIDCHRCHFVNASSPSG